MISSDFEELRVWSASGRIVEGRRPDAGGADDPQALLGLADDYRPGGRSFGGRHSEHHRHSPAGLLRGTRRPGSGGMLVEGLRKIVRVFAENFELQKFRGFGAIRTRSRLCRTAARRPEVPASPGDAGDGLCASGEPENSARESPKK